MAPFFQLPSHSLFLPPLFKTPFFQLKHNHHYQYHYHFHLPLHHKMQSKRPPIFQKLSNFLKVSIFIAKMKRPIIPKLLFLKKSCRMKNFELLQHYNYGFVRDFQFSPSITPLFRYNRGGRRGLRRHDVYSLLFPCRCISGSGGEQREGDGDYGGGEAFPESLDWSDDNDDDDDDDDSIDRRAEIFIQKFYEDMKMERLASI